MTFLGRLLAGFKFWTPQPRIENVEADVLGQVHRLAEEHRQEYGAPPRYIKTNAPNWQRLMTWCRRHWRTIVPPKLHGWAGSRADSETDAMSRAAWLGTMRALRKYDPHLCGTHPLRGPWLVIGGLRVYGDVPGDCL